MIKGIKRLFGILCVIAVSIRPVFSQNLDSLVNHSLQFALQQSENTIAEVVDPYRYPKSTLSDGKWSTESSSSWASGFFPGSLWYLYEVTSDNKWRDWAHSWTTKLEGQKNNTSTHDLGFMIFCSYGNGYRLTGAGTYKPVIIQAALSLSRRFNPTVGCIRSWNNRTFPVIIDNMMNLELLFWASKNGGEGDWYNMAVSHATKTMENNVREDGSTYQIVDYNPSNGTIVRKETHQGFATESTWSRGQAWGLYGFTMTHRETDSTKFLQTAEKIADYYINNLPDDYVPFWDFNAPNIPNEEKDASSAAIAASGLFELSSSASTEERSQKYQQAALNILSSLCSTNYLAEGSNSSGILLHGVGNRNKGTEVDVSLIYADYYFIEAMLRYQQIITSVASSEDLVHSLPNSISLSQNYPNPFNPTTSIQYHLPFSSQVKIRIYDIRGRLVQNVKNVFQEAGNYTVNFDGSKLSSGTYFLLLEADNQIKSIKMMLVR